MSRNRNGYEEMTLAQAQELGALSAADVLQVYSGKPGKCCCGCAGQHRYNSAHRELAAKKNGYAPDEKDFNDAQVRKALKLVQTAKPEDVMAGGNHFATVVGDRLYVVYPVGTN